eukprot:CAMPEP_0201544020 /NCGR_PEP_ID=MMETSP0173_2-20130828/468_1 /ASSEMBLY_ACC=CAM_ASM_000268 /TAXON_ID=218659 /ORGANISM="Vexillifera sp., Strain DIVA3 564/2" /LENGTH=114 /DNA_ID=CAMNT_0047952001 /DNA_START=122 /DNA_END=466 /DNA_ORIENTATION=-
MSLSDIQNLQTNDPFAEADADDFGSGKSANYVHIRIQQRNGRKSLTTVSGLPSDLDFKRILKAFKRAFCCNGTVQSDAELGKIIQLQGDQRKNVATFLIKEKIVKKSQIKIHGF